MQPSASPQTRYLKDYQAPAYLIDQVELLFDLFEQGSRVYSRLHIRPNPAGRGGPLVLDGEGLKTLSLTLDGRVLSEADYQLTASSLTLAVPEQPFLLETEVEIAPGMDPADDEWAAPLDWQFFVDAQQFDDALLREYRQRQDAALEMRGD